MLVWLVGSPVVWACAPHVDSEADEAAEAKQRERLEKWVRAGVSAIPDIVRFGCDLDHSEEARAALTALGHAALPAIFEAYVRQLDGDEDCRDAAGPVVEELLRDEEDRRGAEVVLGALSSRELPRIRAALFVIEGLADNPGQAGARLIERSVRPISALLDRENEDIVASALGAVEKMPERFRGASARLEDLLQNRRLSNWALAALTRMSPPTEGTVVWLRRHLASPAERERAGWLASRIAALRPAPPSALPELWERFRDMGELNCFTRIGHVVGFAGAILAVDPTGQRSAAAGLGGLPELKTTMATTARLALQCGEHRGVIESLFKPLPAAEAVELWRLVMNDVEAELEVRQLAATHLAKRASSLPPAEQRLLRVLIARKPQGGDPIWNPQASSDRLSTGLANCRNEAGLGGSAPTIPDATTPQIDRAYADAAACLDVRLCGPEPEAYRRALAVCCRYAFASHPAWCADGPQ